MFENEETPEELKRIIYTQTHAEDNKKCVDCGAFDNEWCSLGFGVLVCITCSGQHRALGAHITSVRSTKLDQWNETQTSPLKYGGNKPFLEYLASCSNVPKDSIIEKYKSRDVLYYKEILTARMENREPRPKDSAESEAVWKNVNSSSSKKHPIESPSWTPDDDATECMLCNSSFTMFRRRHHCRRCGKCVCGNCAPKNNTRPIFEWGFREPVRHCKECYKSPALDWA